ncbi:hypothetical protein BH23ACT4_BH23ACT4_13970 [soil metagenome]
MKRSKRLRSFAVAMAVALTTFVPALPAMAHDCSHTSHWGPDGYWHYHGSLNVDGKHYHQWHNHSVGYSTATECPMH